jgi:hypothetical protein
MKDELGPRWLAKFVADTFGYFWAPCPLCGKYYSGREWRLNQYAGLPPNEQGIGEGVCPRKACTEAASRKRLESR